MFRKSVLPHGKSSFVITKVLGKFNLILLKNEKKNEIGLGLLPAEKGIMK